MSRDSTGLVMVGHISFRHGVPHIGDSYAINRGRVLRDVGGDAEGLGTRSIVGNMGIHMKLKLSEDSTAAKGCAY